MTKPIAKALVKPDDQTIAKTFGLPIMVRPGGP